MNHKFRKCIVVPAVCISMLASAQLGAFAARFDDADAHWATEAIDIWAEHEVVQGFEGMFRPDDTVTRAEMAVMINRIMNYQQAAENTFADLADDSWYTDAILKLVKQGVMVGYENQIRPEDRVTREEALVMIARALGIEAGQSKVTSFTDSDQISDWAQSFVKALTDKGFINGYEDGSFRPQDGMTRACSVTVFNNSIKGFYNKPGTYQADGDINGYVIVNTADVVLEGMTINGDLILTPGVKEGTVTLKNTTVSGQNIVMGGTLEGATPSTPAPTSSPKPTSTPGGGGGGSTIQTAASTDIIVNKNYADDTGSVVYNKKRYTIGKNAFDTLEKAVEKAQTLGQKASITLLSDMNLEQTIALQFSDITLDGNDHTLTFGEGIKDGIQVVMAQNVVIRELNVQMQDETNKWNGSYGIQAYESTVTLKDVAVTGADAAVLVNGAEVTLEGIVDVSGNEFGGIEVAKGAEATTMPKLKGSIENLKNDSEAVTGKPTVWIDKVSELTGAVVEIPGMTEVSADRDQMYFFIGEDPSTTIANVSDLQELEAALANEKIRVINITADIESDKTLAVTRPVMLAGQDGTKRISFENKNGMQLVNAGEVTLENIKLEVTGQQEGWQGLYALQAYGTTKATLKNVAATGADAAVLVNGAEVTLEGIVDVSGNEFGGIEVAKGVDATTTPKLKGAAENLKNDSEAATGKPTVWIDKVSELTTSVVEVSGLHELAADKDQMYFFLEAVTADVADLQELEAALANEKIRVINITADIESDKTLAVTRPVMLAGQDGTKRISFENKNGMQLVNAGEVTLENIKLEVTGQQEGWQGLYALQAYGTTKATLKNVAATGADAAVLVNGAEVTLEGIVDVSGNEFGGIEVAKGAEATTMPKLKGAAENLKNDSEAETGKPTVWIDKVSELTTSVVEVSGLNEVSKDNDQTYFFIGEAPIS